MAKDKVLQQTKGTFKLIGLATRLDKDGAYKEDTITSGVHEGKEYRSLRFGVKTSDTNEIFVGMFDFEPEKIFLWNKKKKQDNPDYKGDYIAYGDYLEKKETLKEEGYTVLQARVGLTHDDKGKVKSESMPSYDASEVVYENLNNGDHVLVEGELRYSSYTNRDGKEVEKTDYTVKKVIKLAKEFDPESDGFEEITYFEQEFVFVDAQKDAKEGKLYVTGRTIDYKERFHDSQFVINYKDGEGKNDPDMVKLATAFSNKVKFGDLVTVYGDTLNRAVLREVEQEEEETDDLFKDFGGRSKPKHAEKFTATDYITEMSILGVDSLHAGLYTEDQFIKDDLIEDESSAASEFGGKSKKKTDSPFDDDGDDIEDDDLPF
jgi:single-stranded DNA-binding protein